MRVLLTSKQKRQMVREDEKHFLVNQFLRIGLYTIAAICVTYAIYSFTRHTLNNVAYDELLSAAQAALAEEKENTALQLAGEALTRRPDGIEALTLAANLADSLNAPDRVRLRMRLVAAKPDSVEEKIKLADTALEHSSIKLAAETLAAIPSEYQESAEFLAVSSKLDHKTGNPVAAEKKLARAIAVATDPRDYQLRLAELYVSLEKAGAGEIIRSLLQQPQLDADSQLTVLRLGANDKHSSPQERFRYARHAVILDQAEYQDYCNYISLAIVTAESPDGLITNLLTEISQPQLIHRAGLYALQLDQTDSVSAALKNLKQAGVASPHLLALEAAVMAKTVRWHQLLATLEKADWEQLKYLRGAYQSLALRNSGGSAAWKSYWSEAIREAANSSVSLNLLLDTVSQWPFWEVETIDALWQFVASGNNVEAALSALYSRYLALQDAGGLLKVVTAVRERKPDDPLIKSEFARLSLLRRIQLDNAFRLAAEAYRELPDSTYAKVTQAFAISTAGSHEKALTLLEPLNQQAQEDPEIATYMAIILARAEKFTEAKSYAAIARTSKLLNEEEKLLP